MDGKKFDSLTRSLAEGRSRRSFLRGVAGALGGGVVALLGRKETEAAWSTLVCLPDGSGGYIQRLVPTAAVTFYIHYYGAVLPENGFCPCEPACGENEICDQGACVCRAGFSPCGDGGACLVDDGGACDSNSQCCSGVCDDLQGPGHCVTPGGLGTSCETVLECEDGLECCSGVCKWTLGVGCEASEDCCSGACADVCVTPGGEGSICEQDTDCAGEQFRCCFERCRNVQTDPLNCGACDVTCASGDCVDGVCEGCVPEMCGIRECGDWPDGCGGTLMCGQCLGPNEFCDDNGQCACAPDCDGKTCGDDSCGGSCGTCDEFPNSYCTPEQTCACDPDTCEDLGKECGTWSDGCGGTATGCIACFGLQSCDPNGQCQVPCQMAGRCNSDSDCCDGYFCLDPECQTTGERTCRIGCL